MIALTEKKTYSVIPEIEIVHDTTDEYKFWTCTNLLRIFGLFLIIAYLIHITYTEYKKPLHIYADEFNYNVSMKICIPGKFGDLYSQLPLSTWTPPGKDFSLPLYSTHDLNEIGYKKIHSVVIVQHGNLRNANDYFCGAVNSLLESNTSPELMSSILIISPYFPIENDICWDKITKIPQIITDLTNSCGYPIWSNEGWKDGHSSITSANVINNNIPSNSLYSYDVFNMLITHLGNNEIYPNVRNITIFGFSAGAQTVLRYAALPNYEIKNLKIKPRFIISDPSTYFYFDNKRPQKIIDEDGFTQIIFVVPNSSIINTIWKSDASGLPWIDNWDTQCAEYNHWRFGFDNLTGYYANRFNSDVFAKSKIITEFPSRDVTYLVGTEDTYNCKLSNYPGCTDNDLATYCPAMLQGNNRLDRILKWKMYLNYFYSNDNIHNVVFAEGVVHDPVQMLKSLQGKCVIFNICQNSKKFPSHPHDGLPSGEIKTGGLNLGGLNLGGLNLGGLNLGGLNLGKQNVVKNKVVENYIDEKIENLNEIIVDDNKINNGNNNYNEYEYEDENEYENESMNEEKNKFINENENENRKIRDENKNIEINEMKYLRTKRKREFDIKNKKDIKYDNINLRINYMIERKIDTKTKTKTNTETVILDKDVMIGNYNQIKENYNSLETYLKYTKLANNDK